MIQRTTIEIDDDLLNRAKKALGEAKARASGPFVGARTVGVNRIPIPASGRGDLELLPLNYEVPLSSHQLLW